MIASAGCAGLKLQLVDHSVHKPSNVAVYFTVETRNGQPVANLTPQDFKIYEDKQPVSVLESKQTILNPEVAAIHYTMLLIDLCGSVVDSGEMPALIEAASTFGDRVGPYQKVAVYTFDGSPHLTQVVRLRRQRPRRRRRARHPPAARSVDQPERRRHRGGQGAAAADGARAGAAAVRDAGRVHRRHRSRAPRQHRRRHPDARRRRQHFETYVIGAGQEVDSKQLSRIGRSGTFASQNKADVQRGFDEISARIEASSKKFYLLSYCSPSRAGEHEVEIEANGAGTSGRLAYRFNASGFGPNCDPNQKPAFDVKHPRQPPPPPKTAVQRPPSDTPPQQSGKGGTGSTGWNPKR